MDKLPYQREVERALMLANTATAVNTDWQVGLPVMTGSKVLLRELEVSDAGALFTMVAPEEVSRFLSPPPTSVDGFEKFIAWARSERVVGNHACFAVVPHGMTTAIGLFQIRALDPDFSSAEWGFAFGSQYWGKGLFVDGATMVVDFAMEALGVRRLEARAVVANGRGNGALRKIGAVQEGVLRKSFVKYGQHLDQAVWSILSDEWRQAKSAWGHGLVH